MKLLLIGSQHGNELLGEKLYDYICDRRVDLKNNIEFYLANPRARDLQTRCIETDMNQSYVERSASYEEQRAQELLEKIHAVSYDLVLDCHTTMARQSPCIIMYHDSASVKRFIRASSLSIIVKMADEPAKNSLIGHIDTALSLEIAEDDVTDELLESLCKDIERFIKKDGLRQPRNYFMVERRLLKSEISKDEKSRLKNFEQSRLGFYPMLVGEDAYEKHTDTLGFRMQKVNKGGL